MKNQEVVGCFIPLAEAENIPTLRAGMILEPSPWLEPSHSRTLSCLRGCHFTHLSCHDALSNDFLSRWLSVANHAAAGDGSSVVPLHTHL